MNKDIQRLFSNVSHKDNGFLNMLRSSAEFHFDKIEPLGESLVADVFRTQDINTGAKLVIKKVHSGYDLKALKNHVEQQINHLKNLNLPGLSVPELQSDGLHSLQIVSPCPEGHLLRVWLAEHKKIETRTVLEIGIALADCLAVRHRAALLHKAIKPNNIVIRENPVRIQLVDDVQLIDSVQLSQFINHKHYLRELIPYVAPEMTGRIRTYADYFSDLYSMGTVLYECLTGTPPFSADDALSIIHSHLAEKARPVTELNPDCPKILSDIIEILLSKQPEKRYQSATGLRADLQTCLNTLNINESGDATSLIPAFQLRQQESSYHITIPSIMVGRDLAQQQLLKEYGRVCAGKLGMVMLSGLSGIGKTRLLQELELPIVARCGYFTSGKFNQFSRQLPYGTLLSALSRLMRQILTEDSSRIADWRQRISNVVGINGQLMVDMVPELELIIGKQADIQAMPANDALNRFNDLFSRFIGCLASKAHPLVLFIDDMQWCDHATLDLLELVCAQPESHPYLLIIGAYRNNEVDENHRLIILETAIKKSSQPLLKLHLEPLDKTAVKQMVAYMLNTNASRIEELVDIIYAVAGGNPLYVSEILRWLYQSEYLQLSKKGIWLWDQESITEANIPGNISALFVEKLESFSVEIRDLLATAALLGAQFSKADLADIVQIPLPALYSILAEVFEQRILREVKGSLYFFHDQIQAAAAQFLDEHQRKKRHIAIARTLIDRSEGIQNNVSKLSTVQLFSIVEHLAAGRVEQASDEDKFEEAKFNYHAGIAAMKSLALNACNHYLTQSLELCSEATWGSDYEFMLSLHKDLARAALINGDQNKAKAIVAEALKYARTDLERAEFLYEQSVALAALGDLEQAISIGTEALALLGNILPVLDEDIQGEISEIQARLHDNSRDIWEEVINSSSVEGRLNTLTHALYGELLGYFYFSGGMEMTRLLSLRAVDFSAKKGSCDFSCYALSCMAFYSFMHQDYSLTYKYESATLRLLEKYPDTFGAVKAKGSLIWATLHLRYSASYLRDYCHGAAMEGIRCGELRYGYLAGCVEQWFAFVQGDNFSSLDNELVKINHLSQQYDLALSTAIGEAIRFSLEPLLGNKRPRQGEEALSEKILLWSTPSYLTALACYYTFSGIVAYYRHEFDDAEKFLDQAEPILLAVSTSIVEKIGCVFKCLLAIKKGETNKLESYLDKLNEWAAQGPILKPYMALINAEILLETESLFPEGNFTAIRNAYLDAIECAHGETYVLLEAFLNERLYQYLLEANHQSCEAYCNQANLLYQRCGVVNRVISSAPSPVIGGVSNGALLIPGKIDRNFDEEIDVQFLFESAKAITSELNLNKLMGVILKSIMARLGAKTGYLLITENNTIEPYCKGIKKEFVSLVFRDKDEFNTSSLCMAIANYVFNSKEKTVLGDAAESGEFVSDKTVQKECLRSVLCIPVLIQTQVLGVLYFENSLIESVFTESQIAHAELLASQAAIALQNSQLLHKTLSAQKVIEQMNRDLESTVEVRTKELQRKQLELTHAGRLASLGELATGIAHELGQPLQIIQVASRIIQDELEDEHFDKAEILPFTRDIIEQVERATSIISNMRSYARDDDSNRAERIDLSLPFKQCLVFFNEQFHQHKIDLTLEIESGLPEVLVSPQKFQQIVVNLLSNARYAVDKKFEQSGEDYHKNITVRLMGDLEQKNVVFEVEDNGIGMSEEVMRKCMDPFYTTKKAGEGTGLGLSIVQGLLDEFNFSLEVKSKLDKGSLFRIFMPV